MHREFALEYGSYATWHWWFRGRQGILDTTLQSELNGETVRTLASVGCGPAEGLIWLERFVAPNGMIIGIDSESVHARRSGSKTEYVLGDLENCPLASRSCDVVLALDVLEHLDDDVAGLRELARLARPGGLMLITVPALPSLWGGQDVVSHHRRRYTKTALRRAFADAGLDSARFNYFNSLLFPAIAAVRWARAIAGLRSQPVSDFLGARPGLANTLLEKVFASERYLIHRVPFPVGVSLLAIVRAPSAPDEKGVSGK